MTREIPPRQEGEDVIAWMDRCAAANGWATEPGTIEAKRKEPPATRLPYKDPEDRGDDPDNY